MITNNDELCVVLKRLWNDNISFPNANTWVEYNCGLGVYDCSDDMYTYVYEVKKAIVPNNRTINLLLVKELKGKVVWQKVQNKG